MTHTRRTAATTRTIALAALLATTFTAPAAARFVRAAVAAEARDLERALDDLASDGYRFEAAIDGLPFLAVLSSCEERACREVARYRYRALDGATGGELGRVLADGFRFRALVPGDGRSVFLFERDAASEASPVEMRWLELAAPAFDLEAVAAALAEGYRVAAAGVARRGLVRLLLARHPGERGEASEVRRFTDHPAPLGAAITRAAAEGFTLAAMWSRRPDGNPFTVELNALMSRPRAGAPAQGVFEGMTERGKVGKQGRLVGSLDWNERRAFFFRREPGWELDAEERDRPAGAASSARSLKQALDEAFRSSPFDPIVSAWVERKGEGTLRVVTLSVDEEPR